MRIVIKIASSPQSNRILIHKRFRIRLIVPEEVVMQPRLTVTILVLQSEGLVSSSGCVDFALQFAPAVIIAEQNHVAALICHLTRDADLGAVEVVGLLAAFTVCGYPIADFRQGVVAVVFVAVHQSVGRGDLVKVV